MIEIVFGTLILGWWVLIVIVVCRDRRNFRNQRCCVCQYGFLSSGDCRLGGRWEPTPKEDTCSAWIKRRDRG